MIFNVYNSIKPTRFYSILIGLLSMFFIGTASAIDYEVWVADQSNSVSGETSRGVNGSFLHIFDNKDIEKYVAGSAGSPMPLDCNDGMTPGPCDIHALFPDTLDEYDKHGPTGRTLKEAGPIGRLHGALPDPQHKYVNMNLFAPNKGFVGILDADTKEAVAIFQVTRTNTGNTMHMSFWSHDGNSLFIANLGGRILERIDLKRDEHGNILKAKFRQDASMSVGASSIDDGAKVYLGSNGKGNQTIGKVVGHYKSEATALLTPNGKCRQNGCGAGPDGSMGGRPNTVIICPIVSSNKKVYVTFGGGGLLVADGASTPMKIVGEYGNQVINGAGCGGAEAGGKIYLNAGISASAAGATQSTATIYRLPTSFPKPHKAFPENYPEPEIIFKAKNNTATIGNLVGPSENTSGQLPGKTNRRDSHGMIATTSGHYIHTVDRIRNIVYSTNTATGDTTKYKLTSGACASVADGDVPMAYRDDPTPDLMDRSPNGDFLFFAARGPVPVSVNHSAQGACPGAGVIQLKASGKRGKLARVIRTFNFVDTAPGDAPGGYVYTGAERSDPHGVSVVIK